MRMVGNREGKDEELWLHIFVLGLWVFVCLFRRGNQALVPRLLLPSIHRT